MIIIKNFIWKLLNVLLNGDNLPNYVTPNEFAPVFVQYIQHCYKYHKTPTIVDLCLFAGISVSTFNSWRQNPQSLLYDVSNLASDFIHRYYS